MHHVLRWRRKEGSRRGLLYVLFLSILFCPFVISCSGKEVHAFSWFDERGSRLAFLSSASEPNAAAFLKQGEKKRYTLVTSARLPEGYAVRLSFSAMRGGTEFQVTSSDERGKILSVICSIPATGDFAFILPSSGTNALRWLEIKILKLAEPSGDAQNRDSPKTATEPQEPVLSLKEIRFVPPMRGMRQLSGVLEISPHFSFKTENGLHHYEIRDPFTNLPDSVIAGMELDVVLEGEAGSATLYWGKQKLSYLHDGLKSAFSIPCSFFRETPGSISLNVKETIHVDDFCIVQSASATKLARIDPGLFVYHAPLNDDYYLARWDLRSEVLLFLFKDYATQDRYLKRLAFFVEKIGYVGRLAKDDEIASLHGWNAHDYRSEDLAHFFNTAAAQKFQLSAEELELQNVLIREGIIIKKGSGISPGKGAIVSITQESPEYLQYRFLSHELSHALFFTDNGYRDLVLSLYQKLTDDEKWFLIRYFRWMRYDVDSSYLMANEMQAYLVQQPLKNLEKYFSGTLADTLIKEHPELETPIHEYMQQHLPALVGVARQLGSYLQASYGFAPGRLYRVR